MSSAVTLKLTAVDVLPAKLLISHDNVSVLSSDTTVASPESVMLPATYFVCVGITSVTLIDLIGSLPVL